MGKKKDDRVRHIGIIWNNYLDNHLELLQDFYDKLKGNYFVIGYEIAPTTGTPHVQGYIQLSNRLSFKEILARTTHKSIHINRCDGTVEENVTYCKKCDDWLEMGEPRLPIKGTEKSQELWNECLSLAKQGKVHQIEHVSPKYYVIYYSTWLRMSSDFKICKGTPKVCIWLHGKSGVGKSRFCFENFPDAYWKQLNKWWDGYKDNSVVVIDDIDKETLSIRELKLIADRYPLTREVKGSLVHLCNDLLICTSNYSIGATFVESPLEHIEAIQRRFVEVEAVRYNEDQEDLIVDYDNDIVSLNGLVKFLLQNLT